MEVSIRLGSGAPGGDDGSKPVATGGSVAQEVAATLREEILARHEDSAFLGLEEDIQRRFAVSRSTLRQAARVLEHENLLAVRRGARGGFFTRVPSADAVSHVASVYLRYRGTAPRDLQRANALVVPEIARLASLHRVATERSSLAQFAQSPEHVARVETPALVPEAVREFGLRLAALIDNPPLALFYEVTLDLTVSAFPLRAFEHPTRAERILRFHRRCSAAVRDGDGDAAHAITRRYFKEVEQWID